MLLTSVLLFFCTSLTRAQQVPLQRSHSLLPSLPHGEIAQKAPDSLTVIAVRVAFQEDDNRLTTGDGTFGPNSLPYLHRPSVTIDPLPHDRTYFESHLQFAKNYFEKVSGGAMNLSYRLLPDIYTLDNKMEYYSPTGPSFTARKLALLARDTWQAVEDQGGFDTAGLDPGQTAFIIFHAGVGRDIKLTGTALDITPQDIPSLTLRQASLADLLEEPGFTGFPVNGGDFRITNSLILPRTLSRPGRDASGSLFVLQLSTNGLISASIGSYLGLPDLFNTETGDSGIGRFGLMDGESFFSYRGLFPPEPSAWEKIRLGWQQPFAIDIHQGSRVELAASSLHVPNSAARHSLSDQEYFLVENRHRDPHGDGATLTIRKSDGTLVQQRFSNGDETFVDQAPGFEQLFVPGVLVDVDDFDWSLPGGLDRGGDGVAGTADDRRLNGGILIWHVDEAVIRDRIQQQAVNANPSRRGIDLEEADGAQDIGRPASDTFDRQARGTAFDFWWSGNDAAVIDLQGDTLSLYENRFASDTRPDNRSNSGSPTFFEFYGFSPTQPIASFAARPAPGDLVRPAATPGRPVPVADAFFPAGERYLSDYPPGLTAHVAGTDTLLIIPTRSGVYSYRTGPGDDTYFSFATPTGSPQQPYAGEKLILGTDPGPSETVDLSAWQWDGSSWVSGWQATVKANRGFLSSLGPDTLHIDFTDQRLLVDDGSLLPPLPKAQQRSVSVGGLYSVLAGGTLSIPGASYTTAVATPTDPGGVRLHTGAVELEPATPGFFLLTGRSLALIDPGSADPLVDIHENSRIEWPAFVDLDRDASVDMLYVNRQTNRLTAKNRRGAILNFFPIQPPAGSVFTGTPLVADIEEDGEPDIIIAAQDSVSMTLHVLDSRGNPKRFSPLFAGTAADARAQPVHPLIIGNVLYSLSHTGELKGWRFPQMGAVSWSSRYGNNPYNKVTASISAGSSSPPATESLLAEHETYNWPNPASDHTWIRYRLRNAGKVDILIITPGGSVVYEQSFSSAGGVSEEQRIDTRSWESGIYLAMVTASDGQQKVRKMIKIAVIH